MKKYIGLVLILIFTASSVFAEKINRPVATKIDKSQLNKLDISKLSSSVECIISHHDSTASQFFFDKWVIGGELYSSFFDPSLVCSEPYPYLIRRVLFPLHYSLSQIDTFTVLINTIDSTDPTCWAPGPFLHQSNMFINNNPDTGIVLLSFDLKEPFLIETPFFASVFIHDIYPDTSVVVGLDTLTVAPDIITDSVTNENRNLCRSYNQWSDTLLAMDTLKYSDGTYVFYGSMLMFVVGDAGAGDYQPPPEVKFASPVLQTGSFITVKGDINLWGHEFSGSNIDMIFKYEYNVAGSTYEFIDENTSGGSILRDGIHNFGNSDPFIANWDVSALLPGSHFLKVTATDTLGRTSFAEQEVLLSKTSIPIPIIQTPSDGVMFCDSLRFLYSNTADELDSIELFIQPANLNYLAKVTPLAQIDYGDNNGNVADGNSSANNEFGDYYNAPVAAASVLNTWYKRGITEVMTDGTAPITIDTLVERLAQQFKTRENFGTYDEDLYTGLVSYLRSIGNSKILLDFLHKPNYFDIRKKVEVENQIVLLGLGNDPGKWVVVEGFKDWILIDGSFTITVMDPTTGTFADMNFVNSFPSTVSYDGKTQKVDLMVMVKSTDAVSYGSLISADIDGLDDWAIEWIPTGLTDNSPYFFNTIGHKGTLSELNTVLLNYSCSETFFAGDYNDDDANDINDYLILQTYIIERVAPPLGGAYRADANGDNNINIADLIYYLNFLYGNVSNPAY